MRASSGKAPCLLVLAGPDYEEFLYDYFDYPDYVSIEGPGSLGRVFGRLLGRINAQSFSEEALAAGPSAPWERGLLAAFPPVPAAKQD